MSKHTPGPWRLVAHEDGTAVSIEPNVLWMEDPEASPEDLALIAAAPELLEALTALLSALEFEGSKVARTTAERFAMDVSRIAIAKATGGEP